jgi:hypothetical protein
LIGVTVLVGNVLRNGVLVALESRPQGLASEVHAAIGLVALAGVCAAVVWLVNGGRVDVSASARHSDPPSRPNARTSAPHTPRMPSPRARG